MALPILTLAACAPRDGQVGAAPSLDAAAPGAAVLFTSELAANAGAWDEVTPLDGARVTFGAANAGAADGFVAELRFPGDPTLAAASRTDPNLATMIETRQYFRYGTFRSRVQFPTCAPTEEIASAAFMYFSDGGDDNGNGITDEQELDFHVLCGTPSFIVLTAWSDYEAHGGVETFRKSSRAVDTSTGDLWDNVAPDDATYAKTGNDATLVQPGFLAPGMFYEVGIDWQATRVRFFIVVGGVEVTLWTLTDAAFVPQVPLPLMFNLWHPPAHWLPARTAADYPAHDGVMRIDWARFTSP
ncbi:MAG TPA: glycoside hydrolase family 16 protein [Polyangia bacterium]|nr:glycoside hydrolase family 16 protein [Polyangia bacterium]